MSAGMQGVGDLRRRREQVSRDLHAAQLRIDNLTRWNSPGPDSIDGKVLASLKAKRERLESEMTEIEAQLPAARSRFEYTPASDIHFPKREWQPIGTITAPCIIPDLPASLRRPRQ